MGSVPVNPPTGLVLDRTRGLPTTRLAADSGPPHRVRLQRRGGCTHHCGAHHDDSGAHHDHCGAHHDHCGAHHDHCGAHHDHCGTHHDHRGAHHH